MSIGKKTVILVTALLVAIGIGFVTLTKRASASGNILFSWTRSLPITYDNPSIGTFGGTELRAIAVLGGKLYAANDYWQDSQLNNPALPGPQIYRLDSPGAQWQVEYELPKTSAGRSGAREYLAFSNLAKVSFTKTRMATRFRRLPNCSLPALFRGARKSTSSCVAHRGAGPTIRFRRNRFCPRGRRYDPLPCTPTW